MNDRIKRVIIVINSEINTITIKGSIPYNGEGKSLSITPPAFPPPLPFFLLSRNNYLTALTETSGIPAAHRPLGGGGGGYIVMLSLRYAGCYTDCVRNGRALEMQYPENDSAAQSKSNLPCWENWAGLFSETCTDHVTFRIFNGI